MAVIVCQHELIPKEGKLPSNNGGKVVVKSVDWTRPEDSNVGKNLLNNLFSLGLGLKIKRWRVMLSSSSREMDKPMNSMLGTGFCNPFRDLYVDELEILPFFKFVSGAKEVDYDVGVLDHSFNLILVLVVHGIVKPGAV